jgi:hypothetical protein
MERDMLEVLFGLDEVRRWSERQFEAREAVAQKPQPSRPAHSAAVPRGAGRRSALSAPVSAIRGALALSRPG